MEKLRRVFYIILIFFFIPFFLYLSTTVFKNRQYYFISILIMFFTILPFFIRYEKKEIRTVDIVILSTLVAIGVLGRGVFFFIPQFKPMIAITIVAGITLGSESGFLVGSLIILVSNFFFGQGPWTPWQMFAMGLIGFLSGIVFRYIKPKKLWMSLLGFLSAVLIYGIIMDFYSVFTFTSGFSLRAFRVVLISGLPFNVLHGLSTVFFIYAFGESFISKIERVKGKFY